MVQGDAPKQMLSRFRAARSAVLVATMSFWEGVDVPRATPRLVVIDKPFAVPSDPVVAARCRALEEEGQNPFLAYSVPEAAITLKQGFGRLIRTRTDRGIVAILGPAPAHPRLRLHAARGAAPGAAHGEALGGGGVLGGGSGRGGLAPQAFRRPRES